MKKVLVNLVSTFFYQKLALINQIRSITLGRSCSFISTIFSMHCITCGTEHDSTFCPNCGEKAVVPPITFQTMLQDLLANSIGTQKGFFYNFRNLFSQPRLLVESYLKGRRNNIQNPASYLFIAVTLYLIVDALIDRRASTQPLESEIYSMGYAAGQFIRAYFKYFWILSIFWLSIFLACFGLITLIKSSTIMAYVVLI